MVYFSVGTMFLACATALILSLFGYLPHEFMQGMLGTVIYFCMALAMFPVAYWVVDWVTPGDLGKQLLGTDTVAGQESGKPNGQGAFVGGGLLVGMCQILGGAIKGQNPTYSCCKGG